MLSRQLEDESMQLQIYAQYSILTLAKSKEAAGMGLDVIMVGHKDVLEELAKAEKSGEDMFKIIYIGIELEHIGVTHRMIFVERDYGIGYKDTFSWAKSELKKSHGIELDERFVKGGGRLEVDAFDLQIKLGEQSTIFGRGPGWICDTLLTVLKNEDQLRNWTFIS